MCDVSTLSFESCMPLVSASLNGVLFSPVSSALHALLQNITVILNDITCAQKLKYFLAECPKTN